jgi:hypothetical protein
MSLLAYAQTQVLAAARLMRFDRAGLAALDQSASAPIASFMAAFVLIPGVVVLVAMQQVNVGQNVRFAYVSTQTLSYVVAWLFYLVAMERLTAWMGVGARYGAFVAAYNWAMAVQVLVFVPLVVIATLALPGEAGASLVLMANLFLLVCQSFVTQTALGVPAVTAVGFVALDIILGLLINGAAGLILRLGGSA